MNFSQKVERIRFFCCRDSSHWIATTTAILFVYLSAASNFRFSSFFHSVSPFPTVSPGATNFPGRQPANVKSPTSSADIFGGDDELFSSLEQLSVIFEPLKTGQCNSLQAAALCSVLGHFLVDFFPAQDLLNKCIGEFLSNQQNHYKYLTDILFVVSGKKSRQKSGQKWAAVTAALQSTFQLSLLCVFITLTAPINISLSF